MRLHVIIPGVIGWIVTIAATCSLFANPGAIVALGQSLPGPDAKLVAGVVIIAALVSPAVIGMERGIRAAGGDPWSRR